MSTGAAKRLTVDEFLVFEEASDTRHEYFDGEIFAMAGGTAAHSLVAANATAALVNALKGKNCRVYSADLMVFTPTGLRTYPDASITCERPRFEGDRERVLLNPQVIVEVLSESTEAYDRGRKFDNYRTMPSLREYVLVAQDRAHVDHFARRDDDRWVLTSYQDLSDQVELPVLASAFAMADLYSGVDFPTPDPPPRSDPQEP
ncbi:Uma2 family endonuclease [Botrimarina sp.]|uniref:Uma2 family endonuclease n=1 Tax=Botrimarina sp. TaxID=2795802 RepID=UPI0032EB36E5